MNNAFHALIPKLTKRVSRNGYLSTTQVVPPRTNKRTNERTKKVMYFKTKFSMCIDCINKKAKQNKTKIKKKKVGTNDQCTLCTVQLKNGREENIYETNNSNNQKYNR